MRWTAATRNGSSKVLRPSAWLGARSSIAHRMDALTIRVVIQ
ncbi:Uncharacterised protein [Mycobacterium tuberculosis]|nr:Uncharacterised protein [Mycobacterium tuberculosis]